MNPHADDVCPGGCPFGLPAGHRIKDHPSFPESPPVGPLQALREALWTERNDTRKGMGTWNRDRVNAALVSVEEQLAALQRENERLKQRKDSAYWRGLMDSSPKGDAEPSAPQTQEET